MRSAVACVVSMKETGIAKSYLLISMSSARRKRQRILLLCWLLISLMTSMAHIEVIIACFNTSRCFSSTTTIRYHTSSDANSQSFLLLGGQKGKLMYHFVFALPRTTAEHWERATVYFFGRRLLFLLWWPFSFVPQTLPPHFEKKKFCFWSRMRDSFFGTLFSTVW